MVVYRATPADVDSGVLVGDVEYPGYPLAASTVEGVKIDDPALRIAFFALRYDQDVKTPIRLFARDEAGNTARGDFDYTDVPEAVQEEPDRARRQVPRPRRAGDPRRNDRGASPRETTLAQVPA